MSDLNNPKVVDEEYVLNQYKSKIEYYWGASRSNKNAFKRYRTWTIILGSLVTLVSSICCRRVSPGACMAEERVFSRDPDHRGHIDRHQRAGTELPLGLHLAGHGHQRHPPRKGTRPLSRDQA